MSGKYEFIRHLGKGESSTVFLARHLHLDAECAIKVSPKHLVSADWILTEGKLLKSFNHPGIPKVYDIEEDQENYYLIEEFIDGESFLELFSRHNAISQNNFYSYALQLCDIFAYLHRITNGKYYYQDLKPEHVILCNEHVKLIDFCVSCNDGQSAFINGNTEFSAPEVLRSENLNQQSDVYTLGTFLKHLYELVSSDANPLIYPILDTATNSDVALRYETVEEFRHALLQTQQMKRTSCKTIAVIGSFHGCGATHIAISMTCVLNHLGYSALYVEQNNSDHLRHMIFGKRYMKKENGIFYSKNFMGVPQYGPGISVNYPDTQYRILDLGVSPDHNQLKISYFSVLVCDGSPWRIQESIAMNEYLLPYRDHLSIICANNVKAYGKLLAKQLSDSVLLFRDNEDAFCITKEKISFFKKLLKL